MKYQSGILKTMKTNLELYTVHRGYGWLKETPRRKCSFLVTDRHTVHHNIYVIIIIIKIIITIIITRMTTTISPWSKHFHLKLFSPRKKICIPRIVPIFRMCANFPNLEIGNFPQYCNCTFSFRNCRISAQKAIMLTNLLLTHVFICEKPF